MQSNVISIATKHAKVSPTWSIEPPSVEERFVVEQRGKPLAALVNAEEYQQLMQLLGEEGVHTALHGVAGVRIRFDGDRYFVDDEIVDLYGTGAAFGRSAEPITGSHQEAYEDLSRQENQGNLAPYLEEQLKFLRKVVVTETGISQSHAIQGARCRSSVGWQTWLRKTRHPPSCLSTSTGRTDSWCALSSHMVSESLARSWPTDLAKQIRLRMSEFDDAVNCPLSQEAYSTPS